MDLRDLIKNAERIKSEYANELNKDTARHISYEIDWLLSRVSNNEWGSFEDAYEERISLKKYSDSTKRDKKDYFNYILKKLYPESFPKRKTISDYVEPKGPHDMLKIYKGYDMINQEYRDLLEGYVSLAQKSGKKNGTICTHCILAAVFLKHLQQMDIHHLEEATEASVMSFFYADGHYEKQIRSCSYKEKLSVVFKNCEAISVYSAGCRHILALIPNFRYVRKNVDYLTINEMEMIRDVIESERFTPRDRAIMFLLIYTGLRACDIATIRPSDIDWKNETIDIVQQKTAEPHTIAMLPAVGNAIFEYMNSGGFTPGADYLFHWQSTGEKCIPAEAVGSVAYKAFRLAGIRQKKGEHKGTHLFRHYTATKLLESGVDRTVISRTLGHTDPGSLNTYLHADFKHLGECALSLELYPVNDGVWNI